MKYTIYTLTESHTITAQEVESPEHDGYLMGSVHIEELSRWGSQYTARIRSSVYGLWNGTFDINQADADFEIAVINGLTQAWYRGAAECGTKPSELSLDEKDALKAVLDSEWLNIRPFLQDVDASTKAKGGAWGSINARVKTWGLRYDDVVSRAKLMACADRKYRWTLNVVRVVKENCNTCKNKLAGKVKRGSYWNRINVRPQDPPNGNLDCGGWNCGCGLVETDEPLSRGPLPKLP